MVLITHFNEVETLTDQKETNFIFTHSLHFRIRFSLFRYSCSIIPKVRTFQCLLIENNIFQIVKVILKEICLLLPEGIY